MGESSFQAQEQSTSALEQQLNGAIEGMNGVNQAETQLAIPDQADSLFTGSNTQATASVLLNTTNTLSGSEVKAIAGLVAGDVTGLSQTKITITDQNGDLLWPTSTTSLGNSLTAKQSAQNAYDTQEADKVDAALAATLGPGVALVNISSDLNANQQSIASVAYKKGTPSQTNASSETLTGTGTTPSGAAGTSSTNIASYAGANGGNSNYKNKTDQRTYDNSKTISRSTIAPGAINSQSIAVMINSKKVPATELPTIRSLVENAVGFNAKRGDTISIGSLPFAKIAAPAAASLVDDGRHAREGQVRTRRTRRDRLPVLHEPPAA